MLGTSLVGAALIHSPGCLLLLPLLFLLLLLLLPNSFRKDLKDFGIPQHYSKLLSPEGCPLLMAGMFGACSPLRFKEIEVAL